MRASRFCGPPPTAPTSSPSSSSGAPARTGPYANEYTDGRTMRECVAHLRAGWYGDGDEKEAVSCKKLVDHAIKEANILIKDGHIGGLSGTVESLTIAPNAVFVEAACAAHRINEDTVTGGGGLAVELADGFADAEGGLDLGEGDEHAPDAEEGTAAVVA